LIVPTWRIDYPSLENKLSTYGVCKVQGVIDIYITTISEDFFEEYRFYLEKTRIGNRNPESLPLLVEQVDIPCCAVSHRMTRCNPFENTKYEKAEKTICFLQKGDFGTMSLSAGIPIESIAK
jgi:integrase